FLVRLFETEIPEITEGIVLVKAAAREPGERAKVAVSSTKRDVDPIGACVGLRGTRIQVISRELRGEKIDIVEWSPDPAVFVARALSRAKVSSVTVSEPDEGESHDEGRPEGRSVLVIVPDNQLSLAIGKKGQNARLAAKLTGFRVDIKSEGEIEEERRREEQERTEGREDLASLPGVGPQMVERLMDAGLHSPGRIGAAGIVALEGVPGRGDAGGGGPSGAVGRRRSGESGARPRWLGDPAEPSGTLTRRGDYGATAQGTPAESGAADLHRLPGGGG